jgi:acyl-CoA synthetase (AMP-forming)/AMP-acid ligase II
MATWLPMWMIEIPVWLVATQFDSMLMTPLQFLEHPDGWLRCLGELGCTASVAASFAYHHVATAVRPEAMAGCNFDGWRMAGVFGEPLRAADIDEFVDAFGPLGFRRRAFCPTYSMTETTGPITGTRPDEEPVVLEQSGPVGAGRDEVLSEAGHGVAPGDRMVGVGRPLDGVQVEVRLPGGGVAADGVLGEVWVGGESLADGYEPGDDFDRWLATGDVGCFRDGVLFVFGRLTDSFNIRGTIVLAEQAERSVLSAVRGASSVVVVPSRATGAGITVLVEPRGPWPQDDTDRARQAVSALFRNTEVDLLVVAAGGIPRTAAGKPKRQEAWARYVLGRSE